MGSLELGASVGSLELGTFVGSLELGAIVGLLELGASIGSLELGAIDNAGGSYHGGHHGRIQVHELVTVNIAYIVLDLLARGNLVCARLQGTRTFIL